MGEEQELLFRHREESVDGRHEETRCRGTHEALREWLGETLVVVVCSASDVKSCFLVHNS